MMIFVIVMGCNISIYLCGNSGCDWNIMIQVSRQSESGNIYSSGVVVMLVEICVVMVMSRLDGIVVRNIQCSCVSSVGVGVLVFLV